MDRARAEQEELSARRLFSARLPQADELLELGSEAAQHAHVLRLTPGDAIQLFDGRGGTVHARIVEATKKGLRCRAEGLVQTVERGPLLVLVQCLPRGSKLDEIVRMTTELGVGAIRLAVSERCVARSTRDRDDHKLERLERVASEAARQSEQAYLPVISAPRPLAEVLAAAPAAAHKWAFLERSAQPLPPALEPAETWLLVGPEGGFSERDRGQIAEAGFAAVSLGRSILRTETAAVVGVGLLTERLWRCG